MKKGFVILIVKILIPLLIFSAVISVVLIQANKGTTAASAANEVLQNEIFIQNCMEVGDKYLCVDPDSDRGSDCDKWEGCPQGTDASAFPYMVNYEGCEPIYDSEYAEQVAYCCTSLRPKKCSFPGIRISYSTGLKNDMDEVCLGVGKYYDDACPFDCTETEEDNTGNYISKCCRGGSYCGEYPACCGKTNDRRCVLDCPIDYPYELMAFSDDEKAIMPITVEYDSEGHCECGELEGFALYSATIEDEVCVCNYVDEDWNNWGCAEDCICCQK